MKAMKLIMQCYYMRSKLIDSEAFNKEFLDYTKNRSDEEALRIRHQEISPIFCPYFYYFFQG